MDCSGSGQGPLEGSHVHDNEPFGFYNTLGNYFYYLHSVACTAIKKVTAFTSQRQQMLSLINLK
jgi:hypothetical protein